jgi:hypothetical protein
MSIEMTPKPMRELILDAVSDLATDPFNCDQKEDEYLPRGATGYRMRVGFQNSAIGLDLGFYATRSYSLMRPPR